MCFFSLYQYSFFFFFSPKYALYWFAYKGKLSLISCHFCNVAVGIFFFTCLKGSSHFLILTGAEKQTSLTKYLNGTRMAA